MTRTKTLIALLLPFVLLGLSGCAEVSPAAQPAPSSPAAAPAASAGVAPPLSRKLDAIPVSGKAYRTLAFKPTNGYSVLSVTPDGRIFLSCLTAQQGDDTGICIIDPASATETLAVDPRAKKSRIAPGSGSGDWMVYGLFGAPQRIMALNTRTGEEIEVGRVSAGTTDNLVGLVYAISGSRIVWVDSQGAAGKQTETIMLFDLDSRTGRALAPVQPPLLIDQIDISGDDVVWSQVDIQNEKDVRSDVYLYRLSTGELRALSRDGRASMPRITGHYVVWKTTASRFAYGGVYLYDLATGAGKEITRPDPNAQPIPKGYDAPSVGDRGVTWISSANDKIELYHPESGTTEVLDQGGGKAFVAGHYIVWVNDSVSQKGNWHVLWSDLSAPASAEAPAPATGTTPAPVAPTPAPAQPTAAPTGAPDTAGQDMQTYTDPTNSYRLRYPAGSTIIADPANSMVTFVLTREQAVYTATIGGPVPVPAGAERPELILETFGQNIGSTASAPQPQPLGDMPAAYTDVTSQPGTPPCPTVRERDVAAFAKDKLYTFRFQVVGAGQCDAGEVPLFRQMLESLEVLAPQP